MRGQQKPHSHFICREDIRYQTPPPQTHTTDNNKNQSNQNTELLFNLLVTQHQYKLSRGLCGPSKLPQIEEISEKSIPHDTLYESMYQW